MGRVRPGNKKNSGLNGEWATHVRKDGKKSTAGLRRAEDKKIIRKDLKEDEEKYEDVFECGMCGIPLKPSEGNDYCDPCKVQI